MRRWPKTPGARPCGVATKSPSAAAVAPITTIFPLAKLAIEASSSFTASFFQSISFVDAVKLDDASMASFARGKIVVIGATAAALGDYVATPHGRAPGVFGHLRMIDQLVRKRFIARAPPSRRSRRSS